MRIDRWNGLKNVGDPMTYTPNDLVTAQNIDIDDTGQRISRRQGYVQKSADACDDIQGFGGNSGLGMFGSDLKRIDVSASGTVTFATMRSGLSTGHMNYLLLNDMVYYTNGAETGVIENGRSRTWGIALPDPPSLSEIPGDALKGTYRVAVTFVRRDKQESGVFTAPTIYIESGGINVGSIPVSSDSDVTTKHVYISGSNGEELYLIATIPNAQTSVEWRGRSGTAPLTTRFKRPAMAGQIIRFYKGSAFIASGSDLWISDPYNYELYPFSSVMHMGARITMLEPVVNGIFLSTTDRVIFLSGEDPLKLIAFNRAAYPAIEGCVVSEVDGRLVGEGLSGEVPVWISPSGVCAGSSDGAVINLTRKSYVFPSAAKGAAIVRNTNGIDQLVSVLQDVGDTEGDYVGADITLDIKEFN